MSCIHQSYRVTPSNVDDLTHIDTGEQMQVISLTEGRCMGRCLLWANVLVSDKVCL